MKQTLQDEVKTASFNGVKLPKFKGHTKITLTNVKTGEQEIVESDNIVTDAVASMFLNNYMGLIHPQRMLPIRKLYGGVMCFQEAIPENKNTWIPPDEAHNPLIAHCGGNTNNAILNTKLGTLSNLSSMSSNNKDYTFIWDFTPDKGNGNIKTVCLTSQWGGDLGLTPTIPSFYSIINANYDSWWQRTVESVSYVWANCQKGHCVQYDYTSHLGRALNYTITTIPAPGRSDNWGRSMVLNFTEYTMKLKNNNYDLNDYASYPTHNEWDSYVNVSEKSIAFPEFNPSHSTDYEMYGEYRTGLPLIISDQENNGWIVILPSDPSIGETRYTLKIYRITRDGSGNLSYTLLLNDVPHDLIYRRREENIINYNSDILIPAHNNCIYVPQAYHSDYNFSQIKKLDLSNGTITTISQVTNPEPGHAAREFYGYGGTYERYTTNRWVGDIFVGYNFIINSDVIYPTAGAVANQDGYNSCCGLSNPNSPIMIGSMLGSGRYGSPHNEGFGAVFFTPYLATINVLPGNGVTKTADQAMQIQYTLSQLEE